MSIFSDFWSFGFLRTFTSLLKYWDSLEISPHDTNREEEITHLDITKDDPTTLGIIHSVFCFRKVTIKNIERDSEWIYNTEISWYLKTGPGLAEFLQLFALATSEARRSITDFNIFEGFTAVHKNLEFLFSGAFVFDKMWIIWHRVAPWHYNLHKLWGKCFKYLGAASETTRPFGSLLRPAQCLCSFSTTFHSGLLRQCKSTRI